MDCIAEDALTRSAGWDGPSHSARAGGIAVDARRSLFLPCSYDFSSAAWAAKEADHLMEYRARRMERGQRHRQRLRRSDYKDMHEVDSYRYKVG